MTNLLWPVGFALGAVVLVAWFVLTHVFSQPIARFVASTFLGRGSSMALSEAVAKKIVYGVAVVFLFTYAYVWRSVVVDPAGKEASVREQELGDVHLTGSLVRLSLGGFRGVTTCYLWNLAMDKQMKNQLNELEVIVGRLTDLQPHFNTPWLFQSWNLAYNVSNKTDAPADKYFWVSRGVQLLADGERQNKDNPDLRFELASTYQHKICQSDETNFQRSLFQLSLIPPDERDPARFRDKNDPHDINLEEFAKFCKDHPQLIRRLREGIHKDSLYEQRRLFSCPTPQDVVLFLQDNYRVPSLYTEDPDHPGKFVLEAPLARFPVLPPTRHYPEDSHLHVFLADDDMKESDVITEDSARGNLDSWDGFLVAGAWYGYSQDPLPPPGKMAGDTEPAQGRQHVNRLHGQTIIFRHYPARAQSYVAERLEEEGWFGDAGWMLDWFVEGPKGLRVVIGDHHDWAANAWSEAAKMWVAHGLRNHLLLDADQGKQDEKERQLREQAAKYRSDKKLSSADGLPAVEDDPKLRGEWEAARRYLSYELNRGMTSFERNWLRAEVEKLPKTVRVRELFYEAAALAMTGSTVRALNKYQDPDPGPHADRPPVLDGLSALDAWAKILTDHDEFRHDSLTAEESYEIELDYLDVLNRALPGNELKAQLGAATAAGGWNVVGQLEVLRPALLPPLLLTQGPFDRTDDADRELSVNNPNSPWILVMQQAPLAEAAGCCFLTVAKRPWIPETVKNSVLERRRTYQPRKKDTVETGPNQSKPAAPGQPAVQPVAPPGKS